jgi:spermidine/putrescine transport system substrate-binding protein
MVQRAVPHRDGAETANAPDRQRWTRRRFIGRSAGVLLATGGVGSFLAACGSSSNEVVVLTWGGTYLDPKVAAGLQKRYGITLRAVPGESDADFITKLKAGGGGQYDVVIGNSGYAHLYLQDDLIEPLDLAQFKAADQLYPAFRRDTRFPYLLGPDKSLCFPNTWGSYSMTFNTTEPFKPAQPYSWTALWQAPKGKVSLHGTTAEEQISLAGLANGVPPSRIFDMAGPTLKAAADRLRALKPYQISDSDDTTARRYRTGEAWIGSAFGLGVGEMVSQQAGHPIAKSVIPKEGAIGALDGAQLVKKARNRANALKFIDYFGSRENQLFLFSQLKYASCNKAAMDAMIAQGGASAAFVKAAQMDDPSVAAALGQVRPPTQAQAWAAAFDTIQAS